MDCDQYLELMSAALDGELTAEERRELDSHLAVCPDCAQLYQNLSGQTAALRELDCEVPAHLKERIMSNLPEQEQPAKRGKVILWKRWAPVAAAACLALVVALVPKGGMSMNRAAAPEAEAPAAAEPRAPGAAPAPSLEMENYTATNSDSTASVNESPGYGELEMGGLVDPTEPTPNEPQQDGGNTAEPPTAQPSQNPSLEPSWAPSLEPSYEPSLVPSPEPSFDPSPDFSLQPTDPNQYPFENQHSIRVSYGATPAPGAQIIGSVESLEKYLALFGSNAFDSAGKSVPNEKLEALKETYTEEFFRTHRLLCVVVESGSGSNRYEIAGVLRDSVLVSMHAPEIGTADMAAWLLTAEVDTTFNDGDMLDTSITDPARQTITPIGTVIQDVAISLSFENQRSIHIRSWNMPEEGAVIIGSVESLNEYLNQFKSYIAEDLSEDLQQLWNNYGYDQFFEGESLLMIRVDAPSSGDRLRISDWGLSRKQVILEQTEDGATFAVRSWLIVAEVSSNFFEDGDTLKVSIDKAYDQYYPIQNIWLHRVGISGRTSSETTVIRSVEELTEYLETNIYYTDRITGELIRIPELEDLVSMYGAPIPEWFFESRTLLAFVMGAPVTSPKYEVLTVNGDTVTVRQDHYMFGDTCPSTWLLLVEAHGDFDPDNPPKLVVQDGYP